MERPKVWEFFLKLSDDIAQLTVYARNKGLRLKETIYLGFPGTFYRGENEACARGVKSEVGLGKMFKDAGGMGMETYYPSDRRDRRQKNTVGL